MREQNASRDRRSTDPETGVATGVPEAAICVQDIDVQCVLQFTLLNAAGCALHRHTSRVIHRLEWFTFIVWIDLPRRFNHTTSLCLLFRNRATVSGRPLMRLIKPGNALALLAPKRDRCPFGDRRPWRR